MARYAFSRFLFLRMLGFAYFCAFASLVPQIVGLVGAHGIVPAGPSDLTLRLCIGGALLSLVLVAGFVPRVSVPLLWAGYLWVSNACGALAKAERPALQSAAAIVVAIVIVPVSVLHFTRSLGFLLPGWPLIAPMADVVAPLRSVNSYGLFAVMTTTRPEIVVEGSTDGETWTAYEFSYKPGDLLRRPPVVAPHQPRLDWQIWFAALGEYEENVWFQNFCMRLLEGSPDVLRLLASDPFGGRPPLYIRAELYRYRFAAGSDGSWWTRERLGEYSPVLSLR